MVIRFLKGKGLVCLFSQHWKLEFLYSYLTPYGPTEILLFHYPCGYKPKADACLHPGCNLGRRKRVLNIKQIFTGTELSCLGEVLS